MNLAPAIAFTAQRLSMSPGMRGLNQTLHQMRRYVIDGRVNPLIRSAAASIVFLMPEKDGAAECAALFAFVRDQIRYMGDVHDVETLMSPQQTLALQYGDCDDQTVLLCSLFESIGYPTRFVVASYSDPTQFEHVYCQVCIDEEWIDCDPTEHNDFGWSPPAPIRIAFERV